MLYYILMFVSFLPHSEELEVPMSSAYWSPPSIAQLQNKMRRDGIRTDDMLADGNSLGSQKTELIGRIEKKLHILEEERSELQQEVGHNNNIGRQVRQISTLKIVTNYQHLKIVRTKKLFKALKMVKNNYFVRKF